jgi:hypothetical protein
MIKRAGRPQTFFWRLALSGLAVFLVVYRDLRVLVRHDIGESWDWLRHHPGFAVIVWSAVALLGVIHAHWLRRILRADFTRKRNAASRVALAFVIVGCASAVAGGYLFLRSPYRLDGYNDSWAVVNLRTIVTAEQEYLSRNGRYAELNELAASGLLDSSWHWDAAGGYLFEVGRLNSGYQATARAISPQTGVHDYTVTEEGVVRFSTDPDRAPTGLAGRPAL